jgi:hypothetical protein
VRDEDLRAADTCGGAAGGTPVLLAWAAGQALGGSRWGRSLTGCTADGSSCASEPSTEPGDSEEEGLEPDRGVGWRPQWGAGGGCGDRQALGPSWGGRQLARARSCHL